MKKVIVLGAGMVGSVMASDLAKDTDFEVSIADISQASLDKAAKLGNVKTIKTDLSKPDNVCKVIHDFDMVCGALPSRFGYQTMGVVIENNKNYCDISFMPEDAMQLDSFAKDHGVTVVYDCGVAPGMSNMFCGYASHELGKIDNLKIYVGGIPRARTLPWQYKAAFAPSDVIEEYTRPVKLVEGGKIVEKEALSDVESLEFPELGTLEAFNTDGLRSLVNTIKCPDMVEKTMRYPGHIDLIRAIRDSGFFAKDKIEIDGVMVSPLALSEKLLFPKWTYAEGEEDLTVMRVIAEGSKSGKKMRFTWDLLDYFDRETMMTSMARTTAFPCAIVARMIADREYFNPGVNPPEYLGKIPGVLDSVLNSLADRGINYVSVVEYPD